MYQTSYTFGVKTRLPMAEARQRVEALLKDEGFGILTEINVQQTLKSKIDVDFRPYLILGACNPRIAHEAFNLELEIGALLPCNVTLYENDLGGTNVAFMDPLPAMRVTGNEKLAEHAEAVRAKLMNVALKLE